MKDDFKHKAGTLNELSEKYSLKEKATDCYIYVFNSDLILDEFFWVTDAKDELIFDIGELTKIFTFVAFLKICVEKHISLNSYVGELIGFFSSKGKENLTFKDLLSGSKLFEKFSPSEYLESLYPLPRPGLLGSRTGKRAVFFELCRLEIERDKPGSDNLNYLVLEYACELLSSLSLDKLVNKMVTQVINNPEFGFVDFSRLSKVSLTNVNTSFIKNMVERKSPQALRECLNLGGISGFYGIVGKPSSLIQFFKGFLKNLYAPEPFLPIPLFSIAQKYDKEESFFFFKKLGNIFSFSDAYGNTLCFQSDISMSKPKGVLVLVKPNDACPRDDLKSFLDFAVELF
ncbi:MAG: hypothetical protein N2654_00190 [Deltaproteobacteria bacterium]|nr:hypothetical protein [Deltaproteobacteria bacterium]